MVLPRPYLKTAVGVGLTITAMGLMITAIAASAASAQPPQHVVVDPSTGFATQVRPSHDQQTTHDGVGIPPILHRVDSSKLAATNRAKTRAFAYHVSPTARYSSTDVNAYAPTSHPVGVAEPALKAPSSGFDWGDAAIGAGVAAAIALLVTGAGLVMRQRSQPRVP